MSSSVHDERKVPYFNRELSWLAFNRRVFDLANDSARPLLERLKSLSMVSSNLDEFFEIRVAGLIQQVDSQVAQRGIDGLGPKEQLRRIHSIAGAVVSDQYDLWNETLVPALAKEKLNFKTPKTLTRAETKWIEQYFHEQVFPVLTPMAIDPSHPFPQLANKSLNVLVWLDDPNTPEIETMMAVVPVPRILPRVVAVGNPTRRGQTYVFMSDIVKHFDQPLFPGYKIRGAWAFRITRNSDLYIDEEEAENLLQQIEEELHRMRKGDSVRLEIEDDVHDGLLERLLQAIQLGPEHVFRIHGPINLLRLMSVYDLIDRPDLKYPAFQPRTPPAFSRQENIFETLAKEDLLLHHPYDTFQPVVDFIQRAATDPQVFAIKQTLYRTSGDSPVVEALKTASRNGKQVTALIELKARFDELNNIHWARELEDVGVHVVYGPVGLKTHCKCCLVVRREADKLIRYAHLGTGNYNPRTAKGYTDLSYFTTNPETTEEVAALFNTLTGFARAPEFHRLLVAPYNLHRRMQELIQRETKHAQAGRPARIIAKINSLVDQDTIDNLYLASQAGVKIDLIVRSICGLVPGVRGLSDNIKVRSIVGRYHEHSRIFYFENSGGEPAVYLGSADWMQRNFFNRIECVFPVTSKSLHSTIIYDILPAFLKDNREAKVLKSNGAYSLPPANPKEPRFSAQEYFMAQATALRLDNE